MKSKDWQKILLQDLLKKAGDMGNQEEGIENQILKIQKSTKASLKLFCPIHDRLRMRFGWYYLWHLNPWSRVVHTTVLTLYIAAIGLFSANFLYGNKENVTTTKAAGNTCIAVAPGNWNDPAVWVDCDINGDPGTPGPTDNVTINGNDVTLTADANANLVTINSGNLVTGGYKLTASSAALNSGVLWVKENGQLDLGQTGDITGTSEGALVLERNAILNVHDIEGDYSGTGTAIQIYTEGGETSGNAVINIYGTIYSINGDNSSLDATATINLYGTNNLESFDHQFDGKVVVKGNITVVEGTYSFGSVQIDSGGTLDLQTFELGVTGTGTNLTNNGTFKLAGGNQFTNSGGLGPLSYTGSGTVEYTATSGSPKTIENWTYGNLKINGSGGTFNLPADTTVNGNLELTAGALSANAHDLTVKGNWTKGGGSFSAGAKTVTLAGADSSTQVVSGDTSFNNLSITTASNTAGRTVNFAAGSTQAIGGTITLAGAAGKVLTLGRNGGSGSDVWTLTLPNNYTSGDYVTVSNSAITAPYKITPAVHDTNNGNNSGWDFNVAPSAPSDLGPLAMTNGSWGNNNKPQLNFTLSDPNGADQVSYEMQISTDSGFNIFQVYYVSALSTQGATSFTVGQATGGGDYIDGSSGQSLSSGTYYWQVKAKDSSAESAWASGGSFKIDTVAPTASVVSTPAAPNGSNGYFKTTAPAVTLSGVDAGSGPASVKYRWGGSGDYSTYSTPLTAPEGINTIYYYADDNAGNSGSSSPASTEYKVDITPTVTNISLLPADPTGDNGYYKTAPTVTLEASDSGTGVAEIKYRWGNPGDYQTYSTSLTAPEGSNTLYYYGIDNAGNEQTAETREIKVDHIAPVTNTEAPTAPASNGLATFSWKAAVDNGAGVAGYLVYIGSLPDTYNIVDGEFTTTNSFQHTFYQNGTYYIRVKAKGTAGNLGGFSSEGTVSVDIDDPLISITNLINNQFVSTKTFTVQGSSSDELSGISKVELNIDGSNDWLAVSSSDNFATWSYDWNNYSDGSHKIIARAVDVSGNIKASSEFIVVVDTTAPSIPADLRVFNISNSTASVYASYLDFAGSKDDLSGVKNYEVFRGDAKILEILPARDASNLNFTGNENQSYFTVDSDLASGNYSYKIKAIDNLGNTSETPAVAINTSGKQVENDSISEAKGTASSVVGKDKTSAIISWKTVYPATSLVEFGETASYGKKTEVDANLNQGHSVMIPDLRPGTNYHAKVTSKDIYGREMSSQDITFTTGVAPEDKSAVKIIFETLQSLFRNLTVKGAVPQESEMASLQGLSNNLLVTDISFKEKALYQNILTFEKGKKIEKGTDGKNFSAVATESKNYFLDKSLSLSTSYYYRLDEGMPVVRKPLVGDDSPLEVTEAGPIKESVLVTKDKVQLSLFWKTNRGATSQVELGTTTGYGQKTKEDASLNMGHTVVLEDLSPDTTYHFKAVSKDAQNNSAVSPDFAFTTPAVQKDKSPLDIVIESLQRMLRFFQK